jgi:translation elongation factor EF-Ts
LPKNADFIALANKITRYCSYRKNPANLDELKSFLRRRKVGEKVIEYIGIIGEKLDLSASKR